MRRTSIQKVCKGCKSKFIIYPSRLKFGNPTYCSRKCYYKHYKPSEETKKKTSQSVKGKMAGPKHPNWKGGKVIAIDFTTGHKYMWIYSPHHPFRNRHNQVKRYRLVMEKHLKKFLTRDEIIHHKNGNTLDDRICNLELSNQSKHMSHHKTLYWQKH